MVIETGELIDGWYVVVDYDNRTGLYYLTAERGDILQWVSKKNLDDAMNVLRKKCRGCR